MQKTDDPCRFCRVVASLDGTTLGTPATASILRDHQPQKVLRVCDACLEDGSLSVSLRNEEEG